jgi:hypothetical protein
VAAVLIGALAIAAVATGCGGGTTSLTKAEFTKQADAICLEAEETKDAAILAYEKKHSKLDKSVEEELVTDVALPPIQAMTDELGGLGAPSDEESKTDAIVESFEGAIEKIEEDPSSVLTAPTSPFAEADKLAGQYGMKSCAEI